MTYSTSQAHRPRPIIGYTTRRHLLLDLDNTTQYKATTLTGTIMRQYPDVGDCLILLSSRGSGAVTIRYTRLGRPLQVMSRNNYHLVFDNSIGYNSCCKIISLLCDLGILNRDYEKIRDFRGDMTLRVSPAELSDGVKPSPTPVDYIPNMRTSRHDGLIGVFLAFYRVVGILTQERQQESDRLKQSGDKVARQLNV